MGDTHTLYLLTELKMGLRIYPDFNSNLKSNLTPQLLNVLRKNQLVTFTASS